MTNSPKPGLIAAVESFVTSLNLPGTFKCELVQESAVTRFSVLPAESRHCGFTLEAANTGIAPFGLYCDPDMSFDDLDPGAFDPVDIVDAIVSGRVRAKAYHLAGRIKVKTEGVVTLGNGTSLTHTRCYFPFPQSMCSVKEIQYDAYAGS